jgi:hypothetical protein
MLLQTSVAGLVDELGYLRTQFIHSESLHSFDDGGEQTIGNRDGDGDVDRLEVPN